MRRIDAMLELTETLPQTEKDFEQLSPDTEETVRQLIGLWDREFPFIAFTAGYENTNRCDEAIGALSVHYQNGSVSDFTVALAVFCDALSRLRILEGFHLESIF